MWKNADIPRSDVHPPLIQPSATELYYTMSVWYVEECRRTQVRCNPPQPPLIKPSSTEPYYTMSVWHVEECRHTQVRCTTPCYLTPVLQNCTTPCQFDHVEECRYTQVRCYPPLPPLIEAQFYRALLHPCQFDMWKQCRHTQVKCTCPTNSTQC